MVYFRFRVSEVCGYLVLDRLHITFPLICPIVLRRLMRTW